MSARTRLLRTVLGVALLGTIGGGLYHLFVRMSAQPVEVVRIEGRLERVSRSELEAAIAPHIGVGLLEVDVAAVRGAAAALPWVRDVSVRRVWPNGVYVSLHERNALTRWNEHSVLDSSGEPFVPSAESVPSGLVALSGPSGREREVLERYGELSALLERAGCGRLVALHLSARGAWFAELEPGAVLALGRDVSLAAIEIYARALPQVVGGRFGDVASVDLRYPNGFALRFKPGTTTNDNQTPEGQALLIDMENDLETTEETAARRKG
ncbi:MAG: cell division protein FtsQ/DivIB [Gammaproteobacteria bacterium]